MFDVKELYSTYIVEVDAAVDENKSLYSGLANMICLAVAGEQFHHGDGTVRYPIRKKIIDLWKNSPTYEEIREKIYSLLDEMREAEVGIEDLDYVGISTVGMDQLLVNFEGRKVLANGEVHTINSTIKIVNMASYYAELFQSAIFSPLLDTLPQMVKKSTGDRGVDIRMDIVL